MDRIYINGIEVEREDKEISLIFQSPYFTDINNIVSNRTSAVEIPRTPNNAKAVEFAGNLQGTSLFAYNVHKVVYYREGVQLFTGTATLISVTDKGYKFTFVWGNVNTFKQLLDTNIRELQTDAESDFVGYYDAAIEEAAYSKYYPYGWIYKSDWSLGTASGKSVQPIMPVSDIIKRIKSYDGVQMVFPEGHTFDKYYIPITNRAGSEAANRLKAVKWGSPIASDETDPYLTLKGAVPTSAIGVENSYVVDIANLKRIKVYIPKGFEYRAATQDLNQELWRNQVSLEDIIIMGRKADNSIARLHTYTYLDITTDETDDLRGHYKWEVRITRRSERIELNVEEFTQLFIIMGTVLEFPNGTSVYSSDTTNMVGTFEVWNADTEIVEYDTGNLLPLYKNLPDMSVSDFLKNLMKLEGVFAYSTTPTEIRFVSLDEVYDNRAIAADWSDKIMGVPKEIGTSFNSLAQKNWMRFAEDEQVTDNADSYIPTRAAFLDAEKDLIEVGFAPTQYNYNKGFWEIGVWAENDKGEVEWQDVEPRVLMDLGYFGSVGIGFVGFNIIDEYTYKTYASTILRPHTVKASVYLTVKDLYEYDPTRPIYVKQWGHYYAIIKLTTKGNNTAEVELLQLGNNN